MKTIIVSVHKDTDKKKKIADLENDLPANVMKSADFVLVYPQLVECVHDFVDRLQLIALDGTTISVEKEFLIDGQAIIVRMSHPASKSLFDSILEYFR